ncbi:efflux RND transporter periplasmic adaptor subunit [Rhizorhabdus sp.]|uniref:efflux RND transporter periplasmic adaptor subunit n=1 Tax=Rhizorhabdus sp. TaxID=1968843 RepID=UPI00344E1869
MIALLAGAAGWGLASRQRPVDPGQSADGRTVLYWYDPMVPGQRFDKPGKSPFMDMQLVPKYADEAGTAGVSIDPAAQQSLGMRVATARSGMLDQRLTVSGTVEFDQRSVAIVQARAGGFVQRVYARAPGDIVARNAPLADILVPEWAGAQSEFLAVRRGGSPALIAAARQRLVLLGMPPELIARVERSGKPQNLFTVTTPMDGVIKALNVRAGMNVMAGQTLAEINGVGRVWVVASVAQAQAGRIGDGRSAQIAVDAFPGRVFTGQVRAILPEAQSASRTVQVRIEVDNRDGQLRPGMFARVELSGPKMEAAVLVPAEAVIRTGQRSLVMVVRDGGRYEARTVRVGREANAEIEILEGLVAGERIVASGQFLLDSEASLSGVGSTTPPSAAPKSPTMYDAQGRVEAVSPRSVTLSHGPVPALNWPAMTMEFRITDAALLRGIKVGDEVQVRFDQRDGETTIRSLTRSGGRP